MSASQNVSESVSVSQSIKVSESQSLSVSQSECQHISESVYQWVSQNISMSVSLCNSEPFLSENDTKLAHVIVEVAEPALMLQSVLDLCVYSL